MGSVNIQSLCGNDQQSRLNDDFLGFSDEIVIGSELLGEVNEDQMKNRLHKHQTVIICRYKHHIMWGSGILISQDLVLTSAHNLFKDRVLMDKIDYYIYPCHAGSLKKAYKIDKFYLNDQYKKAVGKEAVKFDYALLKLTEKVHTHNDFIWLKASLSIPASTQLGVFGYPAVKYVNESISDAKYFVNQWGRRKVNAIVQVRVQNAEIRHCISTLPGQSGSPIIEINGQELSIVGIHKGGIRYLLNGEIEWVNVGRLITQQLINQLKQKAKQMGAQMFKIWNPIQASQLNLSMVPFYPSPYPNLSRVSKQDCQKAYKLFKAGEELYYKNDYAKANKNFIDSITLNPNSAAVCYNLGLTYDHTKQNEVAIEWYKQARKIDPDNIIYLNVLASALQKRQQYGQAAQLYRQILAKNENHQPALMSLAQALYKSNDVSQAISIYEKVAELNPCYYQAVYCLGCANFTIRRYSEAEKCFKRCIQIKPNDESVRKILLQIQKKQKKK